MLDSQVAKHGVGSHFGQRALQPPDDFLLGAELGLQGLEILGVFFGQLGFTCGIRGRQFAPALFLFLQQRLGGRQFFPGQMIIGQHAYDAVDSAKFSDRLNGIGLFIQEVLVSVNHHAELGAPISQVIIRDHLMSQESQHATQTVANHRRSDMPDVHRLCHIG